MLLHTLIAVGVALVGIGSASPATPASGKSFSVQQQAANVGYKLSGTQKLAQAFRKHKLPLPPVLAAACAKQTGHVVANPAKYDQEYIQTITVGSNTLPFNFDTGSSDLWVISSKTPAAERTGHRYYTPGSSAKLLKDYRWDIEYSDGDAARGIVYVDKVNIGGATVATQAVEAATAISTGLSADTAYDGIVGLAFMSINTVTPQKQKTFFDNVKPTLKQPLFAADLRYHAPGSYDFGYIDKSKYTGQLNVVDVDPSGGEWLFTASGYAVGSEVLRIEPFQAIADTGTSLAIIPTSAVEAYYSKVPGAENSADYGGWVFPCNATLPSFAIGIRNYRATIPGKYINYAPVITGSSTCFGGIQSMSDSQDHSILGDMFLKSQYVVFANATKPLLGFAAKAT